MNADITSAAGKLNLDIISDTNHLGGGNFSIANGKQLKTFGGDLKIHGGVVENDIGFANSPNMGTSGVDIGSAVIDTRDGGSTGGTVEMAGSTTTTDAGVKLSGTQIQTGTGKVTIVGKSGSGKGIQTSQRARSSCARIRSICRGRSREMPTPQVPRKFGRSQMGRPSISAQARADSISRAIRSRARAR